MLTLKVGRHSITVNNPDKLLFPDDGITKYHLINYYKNIAPVMLPLIKDHPISMLRFPNGIYGESFFQKNTPDYFPDWIPRATLPKESGTVDYVICNNAATLVYLANQACITPHVGLSKADARYNYPDRIIFDLDPSADDFSLVRKTALIFKKLLDMLELTAFVMTTGSRGLHIIIPIDRSEDFTSVRTFAYIVASVLQKQLPETITLATTKEERGDKLYIDTLRNAYGQTGVAPYAVRAKPGAPVATPLSWQELKNGPLTSQAYTINTIFNRLATIENPWRLFTRTRQSLKKARALLKKL